jgi:hypothetical protein
MNTLQIWLMKRHCPDYEKKMPEDEPGLWQADAIIVHGYWGTRQDVVASKQVEGKRQAYMTARWLALKAQWLRPMWLFNCGINYGIKKVTKEKPE